MIEKDKVLHFAVGFFVALICSPLGGVAAGLAMAFLAEVCKIVFWDIPHAGSENRAMDWPEKFADMVAQMFGAAFGVVAYSIIFQ